MSSIGSNNRLDPPTSMTPTNQESSLISLPPELLPPILCHCQPRDLLALARTCCHLNYIAVPLYLSRFDAQNILHVKEFTLTSQDARHVLRGLQSSLTLPNLDCLVVKFSDTDHFPQEVDRLLSFISRLEFIHKMTLDFGAIRPPLTYKYYRGVPVASKLVKLLSMLAESKCEVLCVEGGHVHISDCDERDTVIKRSCCAFPDGPISTMLGLLGLSSPTNRKHSSARFRRGSLREFRLDSRLLFTGPYYSWMMRMFQEAPITVLYLQQNVYLRTWRSFLRALSIPTLTHIAFDAPDIPSAELLAFVSRHSNLNGVFLSPDDIMSKGQTQVRKLSLPELMSVCGHPENVQYFLSRAKQLPKLRYFWLSLPCCRSCDLDTVIRAIAAAASGYQPRTLILQFLSPYSPGECTLCADAKSTPRPCTFPTLEIIRFDSTSSCPFSEWPLPSISRWLATFPALKWVSFASDSLPFQAVKAIKEACPLLENVTVDDIEDIFDQIFECPESH